MCPVAYSGCPAALAEQVMPPHQAACAPTDLEGAALACAGDWASAAEACVNVLNASSPCGACLQSFGNFDPSNPVALHVCAAPYLDAACSHTLACAEDCASQACANCAGALPGTNEECTAQAQSGTCSAYATSASACLAKALAGPAAFCNPATYQNDFGAWLQGVGTVYCGQ
jgi:hypothetical protein